jgi:Fur family ferric uptake transcriptional regulator
MLQHKMEIYGICADCLKQRMAVIPLLAAKQGEKLIIKDITGGAGARMRLIALGLRRGDEIDVVTNHNQGRVVIAVDNKRLVIGQGLAQKILVTIQNATPT